MATVIITDIDYNGADYKEKRRKYMEGEKANENERKREMGK